MTLLAFVLVDASPGFFGQPDFVLLAVIYTALLFVGWNGMKKLRIFSKQNAKSWRQIVLVHLLFLVVLFTLFELGSYTSAYLPDWLTDETIHFRGGDYSALEILFVVAMGVVYLVERRKIYVAAEQEDRGESEEE